MGVNQGLILYIVANRKFDDEKLHTYCTSENCLRAPILSAVGECTDTCSPQSHRSVPASTCSVCSGGHVPIVLDILTPGKAKSIKRKRQMIMDVSNSMKDEIKDALKKE